MKKVFIIKRKAQDQLYQLDLSFFSNKIDYKFMLCLLTCEKHKNFIENVLTQKLAFNLISYYLKNNVLHDFDFKSHYYFCHKAIGSMGIYTLCSTLSQCIESIVYSEPLMFDLNKLIQ